MTDEIFMRLWNASHTEFSNDLNRGLLRLGHFLNRRFQRREAIGKTYAPASSTQNDMSDTARAALAGVLACIATTALLVSVAALANSGTPHVASVTAGPPIVAHTILA